MAVLIKFLEVLLGIHLLWKEHTKLFKRTFVKRDGFYIKKNNICTTIVCSHNILIFILTLALDT